MNDRILVPYDGSPPSEKALEYTFEMFTDPEVTALYVVPTPEGYWAAFEDSEDRIPNVDEARERGREILTEAESIASDHDATLDTEVVLGKPNRIIVDRAEHEDYDTIVIGSHGREGVSRVLLGSVAETVVSRAPIPVLVVR
ncbi:universal stress protein [Natronorubrum tibetense]|uniref:UspA domain-containing protein n=1 Tax=Natronorubrum tibetense GA33 TaxID=1114856 RepID=L9W861_9EURY|nr:universal stress protein [Natronorubrum tibetense]ELY45446.1 UspA domain-containing protein [Natronorubrum tibetense GA33]